MEKTWVWIVTSRSDEIDWAHKPIVMGVFSDIEVVKEKVGGEWTFDPNHAATMPTHHMSRSEVQSISYPKANQVRTSATVKYMATAMILDRWGEIG